MTGHGAKAPVSSWGVEIAFEAVAVRRNSKPAGRMPALLKPYPSSISAYATGLRNAAFQAAGVHVVFLRNSCRCQPKLQNLPAGCPPFGAASRRSEGQRQLRRLEALRVRSGQAGATKNGVERAARRRRTQPRIVLPYQRRGRSKYWQNVTLFLLRGGGVSVYCGASSEQKWGARCVRERGPFKNERFEQFSATR